MVGPSNFLSFHVAHGWTWERFLALIHASSFVDLDKTGYDDKGRVIKTEGEWRSHLRAVNHCSTIAGEKQWIWS
jgi:hypothetical protein